VISGPFLLGVLTWDAPLTQHPIPNNEQRTTNNERLVEGPMGERVSGLVIGIAGGSGSGKTTVTNAIIAAVGADNVTLLQEDSYYRDFGDLSPDQRRAINWDHPDAFEEELLVAHVRALRAGQPVAMPSYDFRTYRRRPESIPAVPRPVMIVEGILVLAEPTLRQLMDIKVFVDADADVRFIRRLTRDIQARGRSLDSVVEQYLATVRPMHLEFVEPSKRYADVIIPEGGYNRVAIEMVVARVRSVLQSVTDHRPPTTDH
jgi:uridine kinase